MIETTEIYEEKAVLVGLILPTQNEAKANEYLNELAFLADTAGATPVKLFTQRTDYPNPKTFVGQGKLNEIKAYIEENEIITLRRKTSAGVPIPCEMTMNASGTLITLTPDEDLALDYKYYVVIKGAKLYGENKKAYSSVTSYFETNQLMVPTFEPDDGDEDVAVDKALKIVFDEAVFTTETHPFTIMQLRLF